MFCRISKLNANSVDPDQTPRSAASYLCLHCLPVSLLWDVTHKIRKTLYRPCDIDRCSCLIKSTASYFLLLVRILSR